MNIAHDKMLFLIWSLPVFLLLFVHGWRRRRRVLADYVSEKGLGAIAPGTPSGRRRTKAALMLAALFFIILSLSGPQYGYEWQEVERKGIDIIVALDCSRSMLATDIGPTRLDRAKREVYDLLSLLEGDRIGLVAFAGTAFLQSPLTLDYEGFHIFLSALSPDFLPVGGTDIAGAISTSLTGFDTETDTEKAIILITDGEHTGLGDPAAAIDQADKAGVGVFCVGVGGTEGVPVPNSAGGFRKDESGGIVLTRLDEDLLKRVSMTTGGTYVRSIAGDMDLDVIYTRDIRGKMERSTLKSGRKKVWEDRYQWFLLMAIIACVIESLVPSVRRSVAAGLVVCFLLVGHPVQAATYREDMEDGLKAYSEGDYEAALKHFTDAQLENPDRAEVLYNIGNTYYRIGDYESATYHFGEALKSENETLRKRAYYNLGNTNYRKQLLDEALKNYQEALEIDPGDVHTKQNIEYVKKMKDLQEQQKQSGSGENKEQGEEEKEGDRSDPREGDSEKGDEQKAESSSEDNREGRDEGSDGEGGSEHSYGKELSADQHPGDREEEAMQNAASPGKEGDERPPTESAGATGQPKADAGSAEERVQAERALNRLKDQPGRAAIPKYRKRAVEKDW